MAYLGIGVLGFLVGYGATLRARHGPPWLKITLWGLSFSLLLISLLLASLWSSRFSLPLWSVVAGWILLPCSVFLLTYSLVVELPPAKTYAGLGAGPRLVTSGTYALVRHPTVLWYFLLLGALLLISRSWLLLWAAPFWGFLQLWWVVLQERFVLLNTFPEYADYQKRTPFVVPTIGSVKACLNNLLVTSESATRR